MAPKRRYWITARNVLVQERGRLKVGKGKERVCCFRVSGAFHGNLRPERLRPATLEDIETWKRATAQRSD